MKKISKIPNKKTKREILNLDIQYDIREELEEASKDIKIQNVIIQNTILAIKDAIDKNAKKIVLFNLPGFYLRVELKREQFPKVLNHITNHYKKKEEYEQCAEIKTLIDKL